MPEKPPRRLPELGVALVVAFVMVSCLGADQRGGTEDGLHDDDGAIIVTIDAIRCPEGFDNLQADDVCLAYNGEIPGPTWVFEEGQHVEIELVHNVPESLETLDVDEDLAKRLGEARYSLHRHGLSLGPCNDGVVPPQGTNVCDSTVGPGESITLTFTAPFPGAWHYHDHTMTGNVPATSGPVIGMEAEHRGLFGSFLVLPQGERSQNVFNLHLIDAWSHDDEKRASANGGLGLAESVSAWERFDINVVGLGDNHIWHVTLTDPDGEAVGEVHIGPGVSRLLTVKEAQPGTYTWTAQWIYGIEIFDTLLPAEEIVRLEGTIHVEKDPEHTPGSVHGPHPHHMEPRPKGPASAANPEPIGERVYTLLMETNRFNGQTWPDTPLLEAYAGERLHIAVMASFGGHSNGHTFHIHGHPWEDPETGEIIDAVLLPAGETHTFDVIAGLDEGHAGDWIYHCHMTTHFMGGMRGILRVYEHNAHVTGPLEDLTLYIQDADRNPVQGAEVTVRYNRLAPPDPTIVTTEEGESVSAHIQETEPGTYRVQAEVPKGSTGELVLESAHETGSTLIRLTLLPDGSYLVNRDVGTTSALDGNLGHHVLSAGL